MNEFFMQGFEKTAILDILKFNKVLGRKLSGAGSKDMSKIVPSSRKLHGLKLRRVRDEVRKDMLSEIGEDLSLGNRSKQVIRQQARADSNPRKANRLARDVMAKMPRLKKGN